MPTIEESRRRNIMLDMREDYARLSRYVLFEVQWVYWEEVLMEVPREYTSTAAKLRYGEAPKDVDPVLTRDELIRAILTMRWGEENIKEFYPQIIG